MTEKTNAALRLRPYQPGDQAAVLRLNDNAVRVLSPMDRDRFAELRALCSLLWVAELEDQTVAFLMAFTDGTDYDSVNYRWFSKRFKDFLYIDRIVVSEEARSLGIGQRFYREIERWSRQNRLAWLAAEVDIEPPNSASLKFHERQKFVEVGRQRIDGDKMVSLRVKNIGS